jgi:N-sulfoglucosamine sulfohydrolase
MKFSEESGMVKMKNRTKRLIRAGQIGFRQKNRAAPIRASAAVCLALAIASGHAHAEESPATKLNVLLITADDLGYEAVDFLHAEVPEVMPHLDKFADEALSFQHGFVNAAICAPSRSIIATGRYGHNSGLFGFNKLTKRIPTVFETFRKAGYLTGILGKVSHSTPDPSFRWDFEHDYAELGSGRSPTKYHDYCVEFFARCRQENKPFYFMVNSHDPHRPFYDPNGRRMPGEEVPSRLFKAGEITLPGYLSELPAVRSEYAAYCNSVRRLDDTVGRVLEALDASGLADRTMVVFISDNGSAFPFAKANTYFASNRTPMLIRWPGVTKAGSVDSTHFVSEVDFFATFLEAAGLAIPSGLDGRSFVALLKGGNQDSRDYVFTQIDYKIGGPPTPMRCVQDKRYAYIFNAWSDGKFNYRNNNEGLTFKAMEEAGRTNSVIQSRVDMFRHRVPQEFYDLEHDPSSANNLIHDPRYQDVIQTYQDVLRRWMVDTHDFCLAAFDVRNDPAGLAAAMAQYPTLDRSGRSAGEDAKRKINRAANKKRMEGSPEAEE